MTLDRRQFLERSALACAAFAFPWSSRQARAAGTGAQPVLVTVFLRGAMDSLNMIVPLLNRNRYYALRPTIAVPEADLLKLGNGFAFHPKLAELKQLYNRGELAVVHAVGSPHASRSHFESQNYMERAAPGSNSGGGWLNKTLGILGVTDVLSGVSLGAAQLAMAEGNGPNITMGSLGSFKLTGAAANKRRQSLEAMYGPRPGLLGKVVRNAFSTTDRVAAVDTNTPVKYPKSPLARGLQDAAALIKSGLPVRALALDMGGWDTHNNETARLDGQATQLSQGLGAFWDDLSVADRARTLVLVMTEFGRTAAENGSLGTDHGHGSAMFALGGAVKGGQVIAKWPGLGASQLYQGRDLKVTTDFRDVFSEVLDGHLGLSPSQQKPIFPGRAPSSARYPGLL